VAEKFCSRILAASGVSNSEEECILVSESKNIKQVRDFAFCLGQLKYSEKGIIRFTDTLFKYYRPVLVDDKVYNSFCGIIKRNKQLFKNEQLKETVTDWQRKIEEIRDVQLENSKTFANAQGVK